MTEHTPLPWEVSEVRTTDDTFMVVGGEGQNFGLIADVTSEADAAFIVKACNAFPDLVKALEAAREYLEGEEGFRPADRLRDEIAGLLARVKSTGESND